MDVDDHRNSFRLSRELFSQLAATLLVGALALGAYIYVAFDRETRMVSDASRSMRITDTTRMTFKIAQLNFKASQLYLLALRTGDEAHMDEAVDNMDASIGFIFSSFIDNEFLISNVAPPG